MVAIEVGVAERVHKVTDPQSGHLRDHVGQQRVGGDVEGHTEEDVGAALIQLARQAATPVGVISSGGCDVELEHGVAGRQRHLRHLGDVPGRDDVPTRVWIGLDRLDHRGELVDRVTIGGGPGAPLVAVDRAEVTVGVSPFVPDGDAALVQPGDVGVTAHEPQQFPDDRA